MKLLRIILHRRNVYSKKLLLQKEKVRIENKKITLIKENSLL